MSEAPSPDDLPRFRAWLEDRDVNWNHRVWAVTRLVPAGRVATYGDVGTVLGSPRYARQVGWALAALFGTDHDVPWHRIINAQGRISHRGDLERAEEQRSRLEEEGVLFSAAGTCDLAGHRHDFPGLR